MPVPPESLRTRDDLLRFVVAEGTRRVRRRRRMVSAGLVAIVLLTVGAVGANVDRPTSNGVSVTSNGGTASADGTPSEQQTGLTAPATTDQPATTTTSSALGSPPTKAAVTASTAVAGTAPTTSTLAAIPSDPGQKAIATTTTAAGPSTSSTTVTTVGYTTPASTTSTIHRDCTKDSFEAATRRFFDTFDSGDMAKLDELVAPAGDFRFYSFAKPYGTDGAGYNRAPVIPLFTDVYNGGVRADISTLKVRDYAYTAGSPTVGAGFDYGSTGAGKLEINCTSLLVVSFAWGRY